MNDIAAINKVFDLEKVIKQAEQLELPLQEFVADNVLVRVLYIPADTVLTGKIHNFECVSIVAKGRILVSTGDGAIELNSGWVGITPPGIKRAGLTLEDTIFITVHYNREESELVSETVSDYQKRLN